MGTGSSIVRNRTPKVGGGSIFSSSMRTLCRSWMVSTDGDAGRRSGDFDPEQFVMQRLCEWIERGIIQPDERRDWWTG